MKSLSLGRLSMSFSLSILNGFSMLRIILLEMLITCMCSTASSDTITLTVTPCTLPTAVFDVATITVKENSCNQIEFYQAAINTDPVQIIQDCSLDEIICRSFPSNRYISLLEILRIVFLLPLDTNYCNSRANPLY